MYHIDQDVFNSTFISGNENKFSHKTNVRFNMFPFTASTSDKVLNSFENILGAFLRTIYALEAPKEINREKILNDILDKVDISDKSNSVLRSIIKDLYFVDENTLICTGINSYKYTKSTKNDQKISEYLIRAICDVNTVKKAIESSITSNNALDSLVEESLPALKEKANNVNYISLIPHIKDCFTQDLNT